MPVSWTTTETPEVVVTRSLSGGMPVTTYTMPAQPYMDAIRSARQELFPEGLTYLSPRDEQYASLGQSMPIYSTGLCSEILSAGGYIDFIWTFAQKETITANNPFWGRHAIRHNLDTLAPGQYTISLTGTWSDRVDTTDRIEATLSFAMGILRVRIEGPQGPMPVGWNIEMVKVDNEALYDSTVLDEKDARKIFTPEYLASFDGLPMDYYRPMRSSGIEVRRWKVAADRWKPDFKPHHQVMPVEYQASLCNHLNCDLFTGFHTEAETSLINDICQAVIDWLDPSHKAYFEHDNESWNSSYTSQRYHYAIAQQRYVTPGPGTVTSTKGSLTIQCNGFDPTVEGIVKDTRVQFGNYMFTADDPITTTSFNVKSFQDYYVDDLTNVPWTIWDTQAASLNRGISITHTLAIQKGQEYFISQGERDRYVGVLSSQLGNEDRFDQILTGELWDDQPDWVDPTTVFDVCATNDYFGTGIVNDSRNPGIIAHMESLTQEEFNQFVYDRLFDEGQATIDFPNGVNSLISSEDALRRLSGVVWDQYGKRLLAYEGGNHCHYQTGDDLGPKWIAIKSDPLWAEIVQYWWGYSTTYLNAGVNKFTLPVGIWSTGPDTSSTSFALAPDYGYAGDEETAIIYAEAAKTGYFGPNDPPRARDPRGPGGGNLQWTVGVDPVFDVSAYFSRNATTFSGTPPAGMTLDPNTGLLTGTPTTPGTASYTFTGTNANGSDQFSATITIT